MENYLFPENYVTSEGAVSLNVFYYQPLPITRDQVRFYANNYFECYQQCPLPLILLLILVTTGARVILACRDLAKAEAAVTEICKETGSNNLVVRKLDLASLASIRAFAEKIKAEETRLDILVNNAGGLLVYNQKCLKVAMLYAL